jgi:hypothetical protein
MFESRGLTDLVKVKLKVSERSPDGGQSILYDWPRVVGPLNGK